MISSEDDPEMPAPAGASEFVDKLDSDLGTEESNNVGKQRQLVLLGGSKGIEVIEHLFAILIGGAKNDLPVVAGDDVAGGVPIDREVNGHGIFVEKVQRPDIQSSAGKVDAAGRLGLNFHLRQIRGYL